MSKDVQGAFERLLEEFESPAKTPQTSAQAEADALFALSRRLSRLHAVEAPRRLRRHGFARALAQEPQRPRLWLVPNWSRRDLTITAGRMAASIAAIIVVGYTAVATSAASLPDSPLYSVKLLVEDVQVAVAPNEQKPQIIVAQAARRIDETEALIQGGRIPEAQRTADDAARRIESARAAADQTTRPDQVQQQITAKIAPRLPVLESLSSNNASSSAFALSDPKPTPRLETALQTSTAVPTSLPNPGVSAPGAASSPQSIPAASVSNPVGAPGTNGGFQPISGPTAGTNGIAGATPTPASLEVVAPRSGFSTIGPSTGGAPPTRPPGSSTVPAPSPESTIPRPPATATQVPSSPTSTPTVTPNPDSSGGAQSSNLIIIVSPTPTPS